MKFSISKNNAIKTLTQALKTCASKEKDKLVSDFFFELDGSQVRLYSMDSFAEQHLTLPVSQVFTDGGSFSTYGANIPDLIKNIDEDEITFNFNEDKKVLGVSSGDKKLMFVLPATDKEFVPMRFVQSAAPVIVDGTALGLALTYTSYAASSNPANAPYTAVKIAVKGDTIEAQATDHVRIASYETELKEAVDRKFHFLLPRSVAETLGKLIGDAEDVTITVGESHVRFEWDGTLFQSVLEPERDHQFADLGKYLNGTEVAHAVVDRPKLVSAIKRAQILAKDSVVHLAISESSKSVTLSTKEKDRGMSKDPLDVQDVEGQGEQSFPCKDLQKAVDMLPDDTIDLSLRSLPGAGFVLVLHDGAKTNQHMVFGSVANEG
jgi:DNA polymerase III sliding clamp (beta) subunit (PCNA family)